MAGILAASCLIGLALSGAPAIATDTEGGAPPSVNSQETVVVTGERAKTTAATGLALTPRQTPQSVTIIGQAQIQDFDLNSANDLLDLVPGIVVDRTETDRTDYFARGFAITNFEIDGLGLPLISDIQYGDLDTAIFDRVEAIRGADGIMTGIGNPSATINYVRKRPSKTFGAEVDASYGSWNNWRVEGDVTGPLNDDATLTGRLVYANEDGASYLDYYHRNRNVFYGVVSWDAAPNLNVSAGYSWQDNRARGNLWGALPLTYSDGTLIDYPVSATTSADWTYWDVRTQSAFAEISYRFDNGWLVKGVATMNQIDQHAQLLYAANYPDPETGAGLQGMTGIYPSRNRQFIFDLYADGPFTLFGRQHELVIGANASEAHDLEWENFYDGLVDYPPISELGHVQPAAPTYPGAYLAADQTDHLYRLYAATHLTITDALKAVVGVNYIDLTSNGFSYGVDAARKDNALSPYVGLVYDLSDNVSLYASYTDIFNPQSDVDITNHELPAAHGESYEAGIKSEWFGKRLYATASVFKSNQYDLADFAGSFDDGRSYYTGLDTFVTGFEFEVAGRVSDTWEVSGGYTQLAIDGPDGSPVRPYLPRRTLKLSTTYTIPEWRGLKLGAALRWQDKTSIEDLVLLHQPGYAIVDLMASIRVTDSLRAQVNVNNVGDKKYLNSLEWNQAWYGAPRSVTVSLAHAF